MYIYTNTNHMHTRHHMCTHAHTHTHTHTHLLTHTHTHTCSYTHTHTHTHMLIHTHTQTLYGKWRRVFSPVISINCLFGPAARQAVRLLSDFRTALSGEPGGEAIILTSELLSAETCDTAIFRLQNCCQRRHAIRLFSDFRTAEGETGGKAVFLTYSTL